MQYACFFLVISGLFIGRDIFVNVVRVPGCSGKR